MRWLYQLQARLGLSAPEGAGAVLLLLALGGGFAATHLQRTSDPLPPDVYAAADAAFAAAAADTSAPALAEPAPTGPAPPASGALGLMSAPGPDSTAAQLAEAAVETAAAPRRQGKPPPARTNINTATEAQLQRLPGIGPALAGRIVEHRRVHGPFRHPDRLVDVRGIGDKTMEKLRPWVHL